MDDNVWEYPFGDLDDDDEDLFFEFKTRHLKSKTSPQTRSRQGTTTQNSNVTEPGILA